jgi:alanyl-tRNA synthetase
VLSALNATPEQAVETVQRLQAEAKRLGREVEQLKMKIALGAGAGSTTRDAGGDVQEIAGVKLVARRVEGLEKSALRGLADSLRDRLGSGVVVLASDNDGKVALVVAVTKDLTTRVHAGRLVKELAPLIGGSGGGRPDFAEAGGKDPAGIENLLVRARDVVKSQVQN